MIFVFEKRQKRNVKMTRTIVDVPLYRIPYRFSEKLREFIRIFAEPLQVRVIDNGDSLAVVQDEIELVAEIR
jgi:hypothetical protein